MLSCFFVFLWILQRSTQHSYAVSVLAVAAPSFFLLEAIFLSLLPTPGSASVPAFHRFVFFFDSGGTTSWRTLPFLPGPPGLPIAAVVRGTPGRLTAAAAAPSLFAAVAIVGSAARARKPIIMGSARRARARAGLGLASIGQRGLRCGRWRRDRCWGLRLVDWLNEWVIITIDDRLGGDNFRHSSCIWS